ncbi:MAG TPA: UDP-N-acetylmuramate dehydrogenase [Ktedonobacterales bacterium]|nr:UDP-N-acetylmuramate dehydrogenase [Ktedonobacterales bacterium]
MTKWERSMAAASESVEPVEPVEQDEMRAYVRQAFGKLARVDEPLARHGTFGVGGPADAWASITEEDALAQLVTRAAQRGWPLMLVGNGTNVLYADAGARGIAARMLLTGWSLEPLEDDPESAQRIRLRAGAGVSLPKLVNDLGARGWAGLEWAAGVPGTIGGAVVSNAGAHGVCVSDTLESARVLFAPGAAEGEPDRAVIRELTASELGLTYRHSRFRAARRVAFDDNGHPQAAPRALIEPTEMITGASFILRRDQPAAILERVARYKQHRKDTQPPQPSAGSVFKNPPNDFSGRLIESVGLKGTRIGRAEISSRHANFIVNTGGASAADVVALIALARRTVRERCGVELELEVELRGDW